MVFKHAVLAGFHIYAQCSEVAAIRGSCSLRIKWKNHDIVFLNFCGNPVDSL